MSSTELGACAESVGYAPPAYGSGRDRETGNDRPLECPAPAVGIDDEDLFDPLVGEAGPIASKPAAIAMPSLTFVRSGDPARLCFVASMSKPPFRSATHVRLLPMSGVCRVLFWLTANR